MFKNPFSFNGRIRRLEYGLSIIMYFVIVGIGTNILDILHWPDYIVMVIWVPCLWFYLAQGAKRCHDIGNSGFYQIIPLYFLVMIFSEGYGGENEYGNDPKGANNDNGANPNILDDVIK